MEKNFRVTYEGNCGKAYTTVRAKDVAEAREKFHGNKTHKNDNIISIKES